MASFERIIEWVLYIEDDHRNPGAIANLGDGAGLTRLGITSKNYAGQMPSSFWTTMGFADAVAAAKEFYHRQYWAHLSADTIHSDEVAAILMSAAINIGTGTSVRILQNILEIEQDGVLGPVTTNLLNTKDSVAVAAQFRSAWENHYRQIVAANPRDARFLNGWLNRVNFPFPSSLVGNVYV